MVLQVLSSLHRRLLRKADLHPCLFCQISKITSVLLWASVLFTAPLYAQGQTHTIQPGETLSGIARQYGVTLAELMAANGITDANSIYSGQRLDIPLLTAETAQQNTEALYDNPLETYTVMPGDTLTAIARRFDIPVETLRALNAVGDADTILVGQTLRLIAETQPESQAVEPDFSPSADSESTTTSSAEEEQPVAVMSAPELLIERSGNSIGSLNRIYTVRAGDTLNLIALRTGIDVDALRRFNRFPTLNTPLNAGRQLLLPATGDELRPRLPAREHQVRSGETLSEIAAEYGVTLAALLQTNRIADPNTVYPGQRLIVPGAAEGVATPNLRNQIGPPRSGFFYYTVQPGDTMSEIARNLNTTMLAIQTYNNLPDAATVYNNMELKIPYGPPPLNLTFPPVPMSGTRFVVSLSRQQCWVYQGARILHAWPCSTGAGERRTKAGNYAVQSKILNAKSNVWKLDMPYWLGIYDVGPYENGIHGLPVAWKTGKKIWSGLIGQPATFGCAMLDDLEASILFKLAFIGMPVHVIN
jgi:LysM repeat protein